MSDEKRGETGGDALELCHGHEFAEALAICLWSNYYSLNSITATEKQFGLNRDDCNVLLTLWRYPQMTATDISYLNGRPKNSIGRAVKRLSDRQLVETTIDTEDSRRKLLHMTERGKELVESIKPIFVDNQEAMLARISVEQRKMIHRLMLDTFVDLKSWGTN